MDISSKDIIMPKVSIIILVHNNIELTRKCLNSIYNITSYNNYEIIIIDNASELDTKNMLKEFKGCYQNIIILTNEINVSFSKGCNQGASISRGGFLLFLNNDTEIIEESWLSNLVNELIQRPMCAAVGPRLLYEDNNIQSAGIKVKIDFKTKSFLEASEIKLLKGSRYVDALSAACILIKKNIFFEIGGFDERFFYGQEDVDMCLRLRSKGFKLYHCADIRVVHKESSTRKFDDNTVRNRILIKQKWLKRISFETSEKNETFIESCFIFLKKLMNHTIG